MSTLQQSLTARRSEAPEAGHLCYSTKPQCSSLVIACISGERWVLPWVHFVFGRYFTEDDTERLVLMFASHEVIVRGRHLAPLADEAANLRLEILRELPARYKAASETESFVEKIDVRLPAEQAAPECLR